MAQGDNYQDIPGTYLFDGKRCKEGFHLSMFCKSLDKEVNREAFRADSSTYLDRFPMTPAQRKAVEERDWLGMLRLGGNIYYTYKLAIFDGKTLQHVGGEMTGVTEAEFREMMLNGGRKIEGNRSISGDS